MAVNSVEECQGAHSVVMLSDGGSNFPECKSPNFSEVPSLNKPQTSYDALSESQNQANGNIDVLDIYSPSNLDLDIEKGKLETLESSDETFGIKSEGSLTHLQRALQKRINLHIGGKFMQLLMNNTFELPKFMSRDNHDMHLISTSLPLSKSTYFDVLDKSMTERVFDTPTSRARKYKRSASFNSRRVVLLFSVLSSMGTMVLIFLTLRVRQIGEASLNL